ncbi:expressed unknown protein [Seminavis robusta]|uniref:Helicase-associated domain-containing protein n=1 Tax=Seminavis robusta TaxID=568900 RepID=A0A9N8E9A2_9STRA|nr:expressed unknown protein [Seminavis robusta]|eukprot:Sro831_g208320.1 n/a (534) ;mRNA; f:12516-14222
MVPYRQQQQQDSDTGSRRRRIIPTGEEALQSAMMARSIRKRRNSRRMKVPPKIKDSVLVPVPVDNDDDNQTTIAPTTASLLEQPLRLTTRNGRLYNDVYQDDEIAERMKTTESYRRRNRLLDTTHLLPPATVTTRIGTTKTKKPSLPATKMQPQSYHNKPAISPQGIQRSNGIDLPYSSTIEALKVYYQIHGDLVMPRRYLVPAEQVYPKEWHGVDLASTVYDMKWWLQHVQQQHERVQELNSMGFLWERLQPEWNLVLEALITYSALHGHVMVPGKFVVPYQDTQWPKATWGIPLGNCVYRIRHRDDFLRGDTADSRRDQLDGLNFVWDVQEYRFQLFYTALKHFSDLLEAARKGNTAALRVPSTFVVPHNDNAWPKDLWGYPLGAKCSAVRQKQLYVKGHPHRQQLLENLRFQWHRGTGNASLGWLKVMHAAAIYSKLHHRNLDVPYSFKVPHPPKNADPEMRVDTCTAADDNNVWPWPEYIWGFPLGQRLKDVRQKDAYLKGKSGETRRRQLDALGFNWTPKRGRPKKKG